MCERASMISVCLLHDDSSARCEAVSTAPLVSHLHVGDASPWYLL